VSSLSEHERVGLDDVFLCLGEKQAISDKLKEQKKRFFTSLGQVARKGIPITLSFVKSKKTMLQERSKRDNFKLFNHFRPKNRDSK
jgi:hypothetical protein